MKILLICFLIFSSVFAAPQKSNAVIGTVVLLVIGAQKAMNEMSPDFEQYCYFDLSYFFKAVIGGGPYEESVWCSAQTATLAGSVGGVYLATFIATKQYLLSIETPPFVASALAELAALGAGTASALEIMGAWLLASTLGADYIRICQDDPDNDRSESSPFPYTNKQIKNMHYYVTGNDPNNNFIASKSNKICVESVDGPRVFQQWVKKNECFGYKGIRYCAYALKGESGILCVRTSSTCPCRIPLGHASETMPSLQPAQGKPGIDQDTGQFDMGSFATSNGFLAHCRMIRAGDSWGNEIKIDNNIIDQACKDMKGSSKNPGAFSMTAPAAECIIGTLRNLFEKNIPLQDGFMEVDEVTTDMLSRISADKNIIRKVFANMQSYKSTGVISNIGDGNTTTKLRDISDINEIIKYDVQYINMVKMLRAMKSDNYSNIASADRPSLTDEYKDKLAGITDSGFSVSAVTDDNFAQFYESLGTDMVAIGSALTALEAFEDETIQSSISNFKQTVYGRFQSYFKAFIITCLILYVMILGFRLLTGTLEVKIKEIFNQFVSIGIVVYFTLGSGWKDYGINLLMNASSAVAELMMEVVYLEDKDGCARHPKYFKVNQNKLDAQQGLTSAASIRYMETGDSSELGSSGSAMMALIDSGFCVAQGGLGRLFFMQDPITHIRTFYCRRGEFWPSPNYEVPFLPVRVSGDLLTKLHSVIDGYGDRSYLPVRCINSNEQLISCRDSNCNVGEVGSQAGSQPFYATLKTIRNIDMLVCESVGVEEMYVADGYHIEDLMALGYLPDREYYTMSNGIIATGFYVGRANGKYRYPFSSDGLNPFNDRLDRILLKRVTDQYRSEQNLTRGKYPVYKTDAGSYRDNGYLGLFDTLDCKIEKYINVNSEGLPKVIITAIKLAFSSLIGFMSSIIILTHTAMLITVVIKIAQNYIVGMMYLILYIYVSPIAIPCCLFAFTQGIYDQWKKGLMSYIIYPPSTFLLIVIVMKIGDAIMYSADNPGYDASTLFNADGTISDTCVSHEGSGPVTETDELTIKDIKDTPYACIMHVMAESKSSSAAAISFFALWMLPVLPFALIAVAFVAASTFSETEFYYAVFLKSLMVLISMSISLELIDKFESSLQSMLGGGGLDIKGGIGKMSSISPGKIASTVASGVMGAANVGKNMVESTGRKAANAFKKGDHEAGEKATRDEDEKNTSNLPSGDGKRDK